MASHSLSLLAILLLSPLVIYGTQLWMGTHPNAPSKVFESQGGLGALVKDNPSLLGPDCHRAYDGDLPFLFKVLSVNLALSVQAHPNKSLARELFKARPEVYKDPNHKPEMAIALTPFEAMCGFRPLAEIAAFLSGYPEFRAVVGDQVADEFIRVVVAGGQDDQAQRQALKAVFGSLMRAEAKKVAEELGKLVARIAKMGEEGRTRVNELVTRLNGQFPNDVGCFCVFLLNIMTLKPGEAIFLAANLPHAYISGDCIECMATSDNVVRAGLTPKLRDVETLVSMLDYNYGPASDFIVEVANYHGSAHSTLYDTPVPEFSVIRTVLQKGETETFQGIKGPSVIIATSGRGRLSSSGPSEFRLEEGHVYFVAADTEVTFTSEDADFSVYRAFCHRTP